MDWSSLNRADPLSVPDQLSIDLERLIMDGKLEPGERLPTERELGELLGVSRVSIRQALHELQTRGLIDRKPGRGTVVLDRREVKNPSGIAIAQVLDRVDGEGQELAHIMELRAILEPPIAAITAARATPRDHGLLRELLAEMDTDVSPAKYAELDRAFHQAIAQYTHNPLLAMLNDQIASLIAPSRDTALVTKSRRKASSEAHKKIFEAIVAGDTEQAEFEARAHVLSIRDQIALAERAQREQKDQ